MDDTHFDHLVLTELEAVRTWVVARRDALFAKEAPVTPEAMARAFALGGVENALWNLLQRAKGAR